MRLRRRWPRRMRRAIEQLRMQSRRKLRMLIGRTLTNYSVQPQIFNVYSILGTVGFCLAIWLAGSYIFTPESAKTGDFGSSCSPIDVVYTWVNGSDPNFIEAIRRFDPKYDPSRFDDKNELRYS